MTWLVALLAVAGASPAVAGPSGLPPPECLALLREARITLELGDAEKAFALFSRALEEFPSEVLPAREMLSHREVLGLDDQDLERLRVRLVQRLGDPSSPLDPGSIHFLVTHAADDDHEVLDALLAGIAARGEPLVSNPLVLRAVAVAQVRLGRRAEARETLERLLAVEPFPGVVFRAVELDRSLGRWDDAVSLVERFVEDPQLERVFRPFYLQLLARSGRLEQTLEELERLRSVESKEQPAWSRYSAAAKTAAWGLYDAGEREVVERLWREILEQNPDDTEARQVVAYLFSDDEERARLVERVDRELAKLSDSADLLNLGTEYLAAGDDTRAFETLSRIPRHDRKEAAAFNLGLAALRLSRWAEAIEAFRQAIDWNPRRSDSHNHLATALREAGRCDEALPALEKTLELEPDRVAPWYWLSRCHAALGDAAAAAAAMREYESRSPES